MGSIKAKCRYCTSTSVIQDTDNKWYCYLHLNPYESMSPKGFKHAEEFEETEEIEVVEEF